MDKNQIRTIIDRVNQAFAEMDTEGWLDLSHDDIQWIIPGMETMQGKQAIRDFLTVGPGANPPELTVTGTVLDEDSAAVQGEMVMPNEAGVRTHYHYCDIYRFRGDKIATLTSYVVELKA